MKRLMLRYYEDFRENRVASEIYARLRDKGFDPTVVDAKYIVGLGIMDVEYKFNGRSPKEKDLKRIFSEIGRENLEFKLINVRNGVLTK